MSSNKQKASWWIIAAYMIVPLITSVVSTIHIVSFFELSNYSALAIVLAAAFELGALSSLAGLVSMDKISKSTVWIIFILLTAFQMMGNTYYSYDTSTVKMGQFPDLLKNFTELFGFDIYDNTDVIFVKRIVAILSGAILPVISLCFLHLLMSYVVNSSTNKEELKENVVSPDNEEKNIEPTELPSEQNNHSNKVNSQEDEFVEHLKLKKEKLEKDRVNYTELLKILYKDGTAQKGEELPSFNEFIKLVDLNKFNTDTIKTFLTLCNYLSITRVSKDQKIALMSYEDAKSALNNYLSLGTI